MSEPRKISVSIRGHRTSISLEPEFWAAFRDICAREERPIADAIIEIDRTRDGTLSGAIRLWVLARLCALAGVPDPTTSP